MRRAGRGPGKAPPAPCPRLRYYFQYTARLGPSSLGDWDFTDSLGGLEAPLLVIHGAEDREGAEAQEAWARAVPHGRLLVLPGHTPSADRPDLFFPAVEMFLDGEWPARAVAVPQD